MLALYHEKKKVKEKDGHRNLRKGGKKRLERHSGKIRRKPGLRKSNIVNIKDGRLKISKKKGEKSRRILLRSSLRGGKNERSRFAKMVEGTRRSRAGNQGVKKRSIHQWDRVDKEKKRKMESVKRLSNRERGSKLGTPPPLREIGGHIPNLWGSKSNCRGVIRERGGGATSNIEKVVKQGRHTGGFPRKEPSMFWGGRRGGERESKGFGGF